MSSNETIFRKAALASVFAIASLFLAARPSAAETSVLLAARPSAAETSVRVPATRVISAQMNLAQTAWWEATHPATAPFTPRAMPLPRPDRDNGEDEGDMEMPTPSGVTPSPVLPSPEPLTPSPGTGTTFIGLTDSGHAIPPDTNGAVGPAHVMTTLNDYVSVRSRTGTALQTVSLNAFFSRVGNPAVFDPKCLYDPYSDRFMISACANGGSATSGILLGVSATGNPTGFWYLYRIDADATDASWADYPSIGFNKQWIMITANMYAISGNTNSGALGWIFDKSQVYGGAATATPSQVSFSNYGFTHVPAITYDPNLASLYVVNAWNGSTLRIYTISGSVSSPTMTPGAFVSVSGTWDMATGSDMGKQAGDTHLIDMGDGRLKDVVYRNGMLWTVHSGYFPSGAPTHSGIIWWQFSPGGQLRQVGTIEDSTGTYSYAFPSIAVNKGNDVLIGYSRFSANTYVSAAYRFRGGADTLRTMRDEVVYKAGEGRYYKTYGGSRNRWGDYSNTVVDPVNDTDFWTVQEYAMTPNTGTTDYGRWSTYWARVPVVTPFTMADVSLALQDAAGLSAASSADATRLNLNATSGLDTTDAVKILRKVSGLESNP